MEVFQNYVPNKDITIDDEDPVWMNEIIKYKLKQKPYSSNNTFRMGGDLKVNLRF